MFRDNLKAAIKWSALPCCLLRIIYYILEAKDLHKPKIHMGNTSCSKLTFSRPKSFFEVFLFFVLSGWDIILFGSWYSKKTARRQINDNRQIKYYWFDGLAPYSRLPSATGNSFTRVIWFWNYPLRREAIWYRLSWLIEKGKKRVFCVVKNDNDQIFRKENWTTISSKAIIFCKGVKRHHGTILTIKFDSLNWPSR